jgi:magnesium chelatase subunit D
VRYQTAYPFAAIVGMEDLKLALLLNAVSPAIGGVLVRGEKGTAKSTVVRGLAELLPPIEVYEGCRFACDPLSPDPSCPDGSHVASAAVTRPVTLAELPVGATEDRLTGSLDIEKVLAHGVTAFQPGLLAAANRGILYVDEVNLLHDHLVDLLLDAAALGISYVEREGVSVRHAARFLLVGTMNPEEGELRPQLLDRFGLTVEVAASRDPVQRAEVVRRRLAFEAAPAEFAAGHVSSTQALAARVSEARSRLAGVRLPDSMLELICGVCGAFGVDGMRADLVVARTSIALAAWEGRAEVGPDDVRAAARLALPHRRRRDPFDAPGLDEQALDEVLENLAAPAADGSGPAADGPGPEDDPDGSPPDGPGAGPGPDGTGPDGTGPDGTSSTDGPASSANHSNPASNGGSPGGDGPGGNGAGQETAAPGVPFRARLLTVPGVGAGAPGRRSLARGAHGRTVGARVRAGGTGALHLPATLRAAALRGSAAPGSRPRTTPPNVMSVAPSTQESAGCHTDHIRGGRRVRIGPGDLREKVREGREGNLVLFAVDASGSMAARQRMRAVKGAVLSLLLDAYQRRDKVGLVTFRGADAELSLPPTSSVEAGARRLTELRTGGRTPLSAGLALAGRVLAAEQIRDPSRRPLLVVVTDGRATSGTDNDLRLAAARLAGVASVVVDCESGPVRLGLAGRLAGMLGGTVVGVGELAAESLRDVVTASRSRPRRRAA